MAGEKKRTIIKRPGAEIAEFSVTHKEQEYKYKIQAPTFDQLSAALTESIGFTGKLNMSGGGKVIWELCCTEASPEIEENPSILIAICLDLYNEYALPADVEIKKN